MESEYVAYVESSVGLLEIVGTEQAIKAIHFVGETAVSESDETALPAVVRDCRGQLEAYLRGERQTFDVALDPDGTDFQKAVWRALRDIPFGQTASYLDIARAIGNEKAVRAVGAANGQNKISIIIPCHRIIGSNGQLTGYASGLWRKEWLLKHEGVLSDQEPQMRLF